LPPNEIREVIIGYGHENVLATHHSTLEFTKDMHLSSNGDCILVVAIDKGLTDLSREFKETLCRPNAKLTIQIEVDNLTEEVQAQGATQLILNHPVEMVIRKSDHTSDRTLAVHANKAAKDISRELVEKLKNPNQKAKITLIVQF
jgi:hypothetical protein